MDEGDSNDLRKFVRMARADGLLDRLVQLVTRLYPQRYFVCGFDFTTPVVE